MFSLIVGAWLAQDRYILEGVDEWEWLTFSLKKRMKFFEKPCMNRQNTSINYFLLSTGSNQEDSTTYY